MEFSLIDTIVFCAYAFVFVAVGFCVSRYKEGHQNNATDIFWPVNAYPAGPLVHP